jgi:hypothetical protein
MPEPSQSAAPSVRPKLPRLTSDWLRYLLGFSVSVGVGLAPYLGLVGVPLFTPLLSLIPQSLQGIAIPISIASMGIVAVFVQWKKRDPSSPVEFRLASIFSVAALILFIGIEVMAVAHVEVPAVDQTVSFAVGLSSPQKAPCENLSRESCIADRLGFDQAVIDGYFGDTRTSLTRLALVLTYTAFMSSFGWMVGLLLLRDRQRSSS